MKETRKEIEEIGDYLIAFKKNQVEDISRYHKVIPTGYIDPGELVIDGLRYRMTKIIDSEMSYMLGIELPDQNLFIAQDLVYNRVFPCVGEKNAAGDYLFDGWMKALREYKEKGFDLILPGHGEPCGPGVFDRMIEFILTAKDLFLSGADDNQFRKRLKEKYPDYRDDELLEISILYLYHRTW